MVWTIHYNPACSKCRDCLALLRSRGIEPRVIDYQATPLTKAELVSLQQLLGRPIHELLRADGTEAERQLTDDEVLQRLTEQPHRLQRPIVSNGERAVIARPAEQVLTLF